MLVNIQLVLVSCVVPRKLGTRPSLTHSSHCDATVASYDAMTIQWLGWTVLWYVLYQQSIYVHMYVTHTIAVFVYLQICANLCKLLLNRVRLLQNSSKWEPESEIFDSSMLENLQILVGEILANNNLQDRTAVKINCFM